MSAALRRYNQDKELGQKAVVVAVSEPLEKELERILSLLECAGLVRPLDKVREIKGVFRRYVSILLSCCRRTLSTLERAIL